MLFVTVYRWQSIDDWCWSWSWISNTWATWCKQLTHWKRPWCWERLKAWGEGDNRGWDSWMASPTRWTWFWASSKSWWWTGKPGMLQSMGWQRVRHDWVTELNWTSYKLHISFGYNCTFSSVQLSSVTQLCPTLCDPMNCSTPGLPVHHQLPEMWLRY